MKIVSFFNSFFSEMFDDSHCHIHIESDSPTSESLHLVLGLSPSDWSKLDDFSSVNSEKCAIGYGVHPWFAVSASSSDWLAELKEKLSKPSSSTSALAPLPLIGEVGVDSIAKNKESGEKYDMSIQQSVFTQQMDLAVSLQRAVSIHCVKAAPVVLEYLTSAAQEEKKRQKRIKEAKKRGTTIAEDDLPRIPPAVSMHSYSGNQATAKRLIELLGDRCFFGFSEFVNGRSWKSAESVLRAVPKTQVLVESDMNDGKSATEQCEAVVKRMAETWGLSMDETTKQLHENFLRFITLHNSSAHN